MRTKCHYCGKRRVCLPDSDGEESCAVCRERNANRKATTEMLAESLGRTGLSVDEANSALGIAED